MAVAKIIPLVAGNWKMNGLAASEAELARIISGAKDFAGKAELMVCPPTTLVAAFAGAAISVTYSSVSFGMVVHPFSPIIYRDAVQSKAKEKRLALLGVCNDANPRSAEGKIHLFIPKKTWTAAGSKCDPESVRR